MLRMLGLLLVVVALAGPGRACHDHRGPHLPVVRVIDGDTVVLDVPDLPQPLGTSLSLRILGVDAPEIHRAQCADERRRGRAARDFTQAFVDWALSPEDVAVRLCGWDKYGGRVVGDVLLYENRSAYATPTMLLSHELIAAGHAVYYSGSGPRMDWCNAVVVNP